MFEAMGNKFAGACSSYLLALPVPVQVIDLCMQPMALELKGWVWLNNFIDRLPCMKTRNFGLFLW